MHVRAVHHGDLVQVSSERDASNEVNTSLKAELERFRDVTGSTADALEREKAVKAQLETHNKAQVSCLPFRAQTATWVAATSLTASRCILTFRA